MFHSYENFSLFYENTYESLENLKKENILKKIGVSVYNNQQAISVLNNYNIDVIQIPFNILDNFNKRGEIIDLAQRKGVEIHARSIFLQGLFFVELNKLHPKLEPLKKYLIKIHDIANQYEISINNLAINYAYTQKRIKNILIGVDSINQLKQNIHNINDEFDEKRWDEIDGINDLDGYDEVVEMMKQNVDTQIRSMLQQAILNNGINDEKTMKPIRDYKQIADLLENYTL